MSRIYLVLAIVACFHVGCETTTKTSAEYQFPEAKPTSIHESQLKNLEDEVARYPKRHELHYQIAGVRFQLEDYRGAEAALLQALDIKPNDSKYHYQLGRIHLRSGELDAAEIHFRKATALVTQNRYTGPHAALGYVLAKSERYAEAIAEFKRCVEIEPENPSFYYFLGSVYDILGDHEATIDHFQGYLTRGGVTYRDKVQFILEKLGVEVVELPYVGADNLRDETAVPGFGEGI